MTKIPYITWYRTIQGEGKYAGRQAVFLRLGFCPVQCNFCDTKYSWKPVRPSELGDDFWKEVERVGLVVITGGEPLYTQIPISFLKSLPEKHIETSLHITDKFYENAISILSEMDFIVISPKQERFEPKIPFSFQLLNFVIESGRNFILKFVVGMKEDLEFVERFEKFVEKDKIYLMPEGEDLENYLKNKQMVMELAEEKGYRFSPRLHIEMGLP